MPLERSGGTVAAKDQHCGAGFNATERERSMRLLGSLRHGDAAGGTFAAHVQPPTGPSARRRWPLLASAAVIALATGAGASALLRSVVPPAVEAPLETAASASLSGLQASGFVVAARQATVSADITGRVVEVTVAEGAEVKKGDIIARLDTRILTTEAAQATAQVQAVERNADVTRSRLSASQTVLRRREALAATDVVSRASLDEARDAVLALKAQLAADESATEVARRQLARSQAQLASTSIVAPFDGVVNALSANVGEIVSPISAGGGFTRTGICTIVDLTSLEGEVDVSEQYLNRVSRGQRINARLAAYPELRIVGRVSTITAAVNRSTAAAKLKVTFDLIPPEMLPGMRIDVSFDPAV